METYKVKQEGKYPGKGFKTLFPPSNLFSSSHTEGSFSFQIILRPECLRKANMWHPWPFTQKCPTPFLLAHGHLFSEFPFSLQHLPCHPSENVLLWSSKNDPRRTRQRVREQWREETTPEPSFGAGQGPEAGDPLVLVSFSFALYEEHTLGRHHLDPSQGRSLRFK